MRLPIIVVLLAAAVEATAAEAPKSPPLTVENINKQTGIIRNPGLAVDHAMDVLGKSAEAALKKSGPAILESSPQRIGDPTQMTGSFSQALSRLRAKAGTGNGKPEASQMPKIELAAKVTLHDKKAVILKFGGKSHLVKEGGKMSFLDQTTLYEIQVDRIENDFVTLTVLPLGQKLILE